MHALAYVHERPMSHMCFARGEAIYSVRNYATWIYLDSHVSRRTLEHLHSLAPPRAEIWRYLAPDG
jgi:hypothetical protein